MWCHDTVGALIGITLGAAGIPQLSLAIESFTDTRAACYSALCVMERKLESDRDGTLKNSSKKVSCSAMVNSLPEYAIDSSTSEGKSASSLNGEIRFDNVSFSYPSRHESLVLENISLSLKPGQTIGVVGPSGSGVSQFTALYMNGFRLLEAHILHVNYSSSSRKVQLYRFWSAFTMLHQDQSQ